MAVESQSVRESLSVSCEGESVCEGLQAGKEKGNLESVAGSQVGVASYMPGQGG